ncbi:sirohydrochlorin chelatase [Mycolicibacter arupensis]|jgi:sirohydrochlorin ferrochelatase|uniref:Sirohydrochlorin chelatase n=1 Tax=Mycolicibacter arupensis TaxID=342002 RepID=A0A0F5N398_9MYCO|nr:sirohydrochlorin chelatase [Mycolicibacter arupensis]KAA1431485.1 sirohydrochlorin chelatase [Mycolicibacter arupensis]KKC01345.1 sirohydrochlorin ferrochelatase [Mycolicibacter arupensis]MCV7276909.1 sirohydrochlorin chelatase [Mycolicibacter arupensis]ORA00843.1 sirohydrochlorin chelatase [Mycolicibacter arupensis]TXI60583.1 MAG: sirohydrochlorin chelatase [Mycolicibacter arupensis]
MRTARLVTSTLVLTAHGSRDPRSAANTRAIAGHLRRVAPEYAVRVAFCENSTPNLRDVLSTVPHGRDSDTVVVPLLLASAYHARIDIPAMIAEAGVDVRVAPTLGEDSRLVRVLGERLTSAGASRFDPELGVVVVAVGSSRAAANAQTATIAAPLARGTRWAGVEVAFATQDLHPSVPEAVDRLRARGATKLMIAPWFLAHGRITDRIAAYASHAGIPMAEPLGAHRLVAATALDHAESALAAPAAA